MSCPICRCESGENDGFILADKPDYYYLQDQMSKSLFEIAKAPSKKQSNKNELRQQNASNSEIDSD